MTQATILITGSNRGIGLALCQHFALLDWRVLACCRVPEKAEQLQALARQHQNIDVYPLDVTDYSQMAALAAQLHDVSIDVLLNNSGSYGPKNYSFGSVDPVAWREVLEVNTIAPLMLAQAFAPQVAASRRKLIAIMSSKVGSISDNSGGGSYIYRSSKTAVNQVVKSLSIDLANQGITTISLHPGWVQTEMGGPNALISAQESVTGLSKVLHEVTIEQSGLFFEYTGKIIPW